MRHVAIIALFLVTLPVSADANPRVTHGPILGRVSSEGIGIWARTSLPTDLKVRYGTAPNRLDSSSESVRVELSHDNTNWIQLSGLKPATRYWYEVLAGDRVAGPTGSFQTLPSPDHYRHPQLNPKGLFNFRFEFACGNNQSPEHGNGPSLPTYTTMLRDIKDKIDFAVLNGDWLYEDERRYSRDQWIEQVAIQPSDTPKVVQVTPAIVGVWENYKTYLSRASNLAEWHRHIPSFFTFDDHEIVNDVYGSGEIGRRDRRAVFRDPALQAWYDYVGWSNPVVTKQGIHFGRVRLEQGSDVLTDPDADFGAINWDEAANLHVLWSDPQDGVQERFYTGGDGDPNAGVYEVVKVLDRNRLRIRPPFRESRSSSYSIGRQSYAKFSVSNCDFYLLDTRTNRQMHDVRNPAKKGLSMLGVQQRKWLMDEMTSSEADFHFLFSSVNFMIPHIGGGGVQFDEQNKDDAWTVFLDERETLIDFWDSLGKPVFVLTGDLHNSFAIKITDRVWEFASGPHNSVNHRPSDEGDRPATGRYQYGPRPCEIRWSSYVQEDIPREARMFPMFCVVQVNNVYNNPVELEGERWVAYPQPQVIFQYFDGHTGDLRYAEAISLTADSPLTKTDWQSRSGATVETKN